MTFPQEIYGQIISYITDGKSLFALLLTSRTLNCEAERVLYRDLNQVKRSGIGWTLPHQDKILQHLSSCGRVANHVRSIEISLDADSTWEVLCVTGALNALKNLKSLGLFQIQGHPKSIPSSLISTIFFQLLKFSTNFSLDHQLKSFLQSQPQITYLRIMEHWDPDYSDLIILSRTDLPALTSLHFTDLSDFNRTQTLFPDFFITNLNLHVYKRIPFPLPTVRALKAVAPYQIGSLPLIFPNLRFLDTEFLYIDFEIPPGLLKLKIWRDDDDPPTNHVVGISLKIYASHQNIKCAEVCDTADKLEGKVTIHRVQEPLNPHPMAREPVSETSVENYLYHRWEWADWVDWQG